MKEIFTFILIIACIWWVGSKAYDNYLNGEKKPFWKGTELVQVCKKPYYSSDECYRLKVALDGDDTAIIYFNNGGYKYVSDLTCYFSGSEPRYTFCRSWDSDGNQWDFLPMSVRY